MQSLPRPGAAGPLVLLMPLAAAAPVGPPGDEEAEETPLVQAADDVFGMLRNKRGLTIRTLPASDTARYPFSAQDGSSDGEAIHYGCAYNADSLCARGRLTGLSIRLLPGDVVGLQLRGSQEQYANNGSKVQGQVGISGNVELPIYAPSALPPSLNP